MRLIVEADGASRGNPGPASYGALVRDAESGVVLVELADYLGETTNNVAEYTGLLEGLRAAREIDPEAHVEVRLDSKLVIEQMSGNWAIKNVALRRIALEARDVFPRNQLSYTWVPRDQNSAADALGNEALDAQAVGRPARVHRHRRADGPRSGGAPAGLPAGPTASSSASDPTPRPSLPGWGPDLGDPTLVMLVRHGATEHSLAKRFSGSGGADLPLAEIGHHQARSAAALVAARGGADVIVSSPLLRTRETANAISAELDVPVIVLDDLRECAFGEWDGFTFRESRERWPEHVDKWLASPHVAPPGGESFADVATRVVDALSHITTTYSGQRVVVVAHVTPIKAMISTTLRAPLSSLYRMEVVPGSVSTLAWFRDGNASLRGFNEVGPGHRLA